MRLIRAGKQLGQAVKNVSRLRQILGVLAKHGFADIVDRMDLGKFLPTRLAAIATANGEQTLPERLRLTFEELGPTFVKLGQLLSTRSDLLPEEFIAEFTKLQDNVQPLSFETVKLTVERELKRPLSEAYSFFDPTPLAAASIGQVHEARLNSGEKVVVKIQRPEIGKIIDTDVSLLAFLAGLLEKYIPESRVIGPKVIVDEFFKTLSFELDFLVEANNMRKIAENMREFPEIVVPKVFKEYSTQHILTLEKVDGIRANDLKAIELAGIDRKKIVQAGARAFFKSVMVDGLFHGDLHGGNLFILPGDRLAIIDFGIVGRLSRRSRDQLANMVMSLLTEDFENLCYQYAELGAVEASVDFDAFQRDVRNTLSPYMGLSLSEMNVGRVLIEATRIATRHDIKVPGDWMIVFKAILTLEGMGRTLDPEFDMMAAGEDLVKNLIKEQYSPQQIGKDLLWVAKDAANLLQVLHRQIRWMFRKLNRNDFAFEIKSPELRELRVQLDTNGRRMSRSIAASGLFVAASIAMQHNTDRMIAGYPVASVVFTALGAFLLLGVFKR
jgi:ubiquinone biosynthesis protein